MGKKRKGKDPNNKLHFSAHEYSCHDTAVHLVFKVSVYWCMYSAITNEMRLYDGNWWQPVVIFRWLMMRATMRRNRSKQLIYMARHNSHSSVSSSNSEKCLFVCLRACECLFGRERERTRERFRERTEAFVVDVF